LDLLEGRQLERWNVTFGPGKAFLAAMDAPSKPQAMLLHQLIAADRTFLVPFLQRLVDSDYDFGVGKYLGLETQVKEVWAEVWDAHRQELSNLEPPLPDDTTVGKRTLLHHAAARIRFLNKTEGLGLNVDKLRTLSDQFDGCAESADMPSDSFARIKRSIHGLAPEESSGQDLQEAILSAFSTLQRAGYMSAFGAYLFVNEKLGPTKYADWTTFVNHVRTERQFVSKSSFRRDDFLVGLNAVRVSQ
jgi:hypothetical protein